jgi:hypothetical protein
MTPEQMEHAIEFLLDHHSRLSLVSERHSEQIGQLTADLQLLGQKVDSIVTEMRDGFNRLIASDELTNTLIEKVTLLGIQTSKRVTDVEHRLTDLES